jgi:hypothetical protein
MKPDFKLPTLLEVEEKRVKGFQNAVPKFNTYHLKYGFLQVTLKAKLA